MSIFLAAAVGGFLFNWLMPQGIGYFPREISHPLWQPIELREAFNRFNRNALFVDARDPGQYKQEHVAKAVNLPPAERKLFFPLLKQALRSADCIVVYGRTYSSWPATTIAQWLRHQGLKKVFVLTAGFADWGKAGYPTSRDLTEANKL